MAVIPEEDRLPERQTKRSRVRTKTRRRLKTVEIILIVLVALAVIAAVIGCIIYYSNVNGIDIGDDVYMYANGTRYEFPGPIELNYSAEEGSHITSGGIDTELYSRPLYYNEYKLILTAPFLTHDSVVKQSFRVPRFTVVYSDETNEVYFIRSIIADNGSSSGDKRVDLPESFLFDGGDTYVFLKTTTITVGEQSITVPPLSFAVVVLDRTAEIINSRTGETLFVKCTGIPVIAVQAQCQIDLGLDIVTNSDGSAQILLPDVSVLNELP